MDVCSVCLLFSRAFLTVVNGVVTTSQTNGVTLFPSVGYRKYIWFIFGKFYYLLYIAFYILFKGVCLCFAFKINSGTQKYKNTT